MWCSKCRVDVVVVASPKDGAALECIECRRIIFIDGPSSGVRAPLLASAAWAVPVRQETNFATQQFRRFDRSHSSVTVETAGLKGVDEKEFARPIPETGRSHASFLVWSALTIGLASMTCGAVLVSWSIINNQNELWQIGTPASLGGLILLLVGMVLQLDLLSFNTPKTAIVLPARESNRQESETPTLTPEPNAIMRDLRNRLDEFITKVPFDT